MENFIISLAVLGVSVIVLAIPTIKAILFLVGILFLAYMGFVTWKSKANRSTTLDAALSANK
ncbi:LysE family transporter [Paenibacillus whitsoniae]|uniref:LysE family transporter n=1 Tax=Paenibacillus whitsoniae TaxID=2496558 RepID=UPI001F49F7F2|nr:LysE family transporter [Paenibacillus whitsoniae]